MYETAKEMMLMTESTRIDPVNALCQRVEALRHTLIDHFGCVDAVPLKLKASYLAVALTAAELEAQPRPTLTLSRPRGQA